MQIQEGDVVWYFHHLVRTQGEVCLAWESDDDSRWAGNVADNLAMLIEIGGCNQDSASHQLPEAFLVVVFRQRYFWRLMPPNVDSQRLGSWTALGGAWSDGHASVCHRDNLCVGVFRQDSWHRLFRAHQNTFAASVLDLQHGISVFFFLLTHDWCWRLVGERLLTVNC